MEEWKLSSLRAKFAFYNINYFKKDYEITIYAYTFKSSIDLGFGYVARSQRSWMTVNLKSNLPHRSSKCSVSALVHPLNRENWVD